MLALFLCLLVYGYNSNSALYCTADGGGAAAVMWACGPDSGVPCRSAQGKHCTDTVTVMYCTVGG